MFTPSFIASLTSKIASLPLHEGKEFIPEAFDISKAGDSAYIMGFACRVENARRDFEKANQFPSPEGMLKEFTLGLLAELFQSTDVSEFPTEFNALKDSVIKKLDFLHYSSGEFGELLIKSLKIGAQFKPGHLERINSFQSEVIDKEVNFSALVVKHKITKSFAILLKENSKIQNDRLGQTKTEMENSTMTAQAAISKIMKEETPYAPPAPTPPAPPKAPPTKKK